MKKLVLIILVLLLSTSLFSQVKAKLDTINISILRSNVPIETTIDYLILFFKNCNPDSFCFNLKYSFFKNNNSNKVIDTIGNFNQISYFKRGFQYIEKNNMIRLLAIDFKKNPSVFISNGKITLERNLSLESIMKEYNISFNDLTYNSCLPPFDDYDNTNFICILFSTGEKHGEMIKLFFDKENKLRYLYIEPCLF